MSTKNVESIDLESPASARRRGGSDRQAEEENIVASDIIYDIDTAPPWHLAMVLGFQHYLTMFGSTLSIPFFLMPSMCMEDDDPSRGYIISTMFYVSGVCTLLQSTFGNRLPIIQGGTFAFLAPAFALLSQDNLKCPTEGDKIFNVTSRTWSSNVNYTEKTEEWQVRMRALQGAIIVSSISQLLLGLTGLTGVLLRFVTPLTIVPAVTMIGLSLFGEASGIASKNWGISIGTMLSMILFSQYLRDVGLPVPVYVRGKGWRVKKFFVFRLFPVLLTILFMWSICAILTYVSNLYRTDPETYPAPPLSSNDPARTDLKLGLLYKSAWFRHPYPFQWGLPTVSAAGVFGMLAGIFAGIIESIGDYYACARLAGAPPPPKHAVNRGIAMEGLGCILAGLFGTGNGTTSYSENIGAIGVTKVGSRRVIQFGALCMILMGVFSKFGAVFATIPEPIVGGIFYIMFGMVAAVGLSSLQYVDLNSTRNLFILGFSIFFGLAFPKWMKSPEAKLLLDSNILFEGYSESNKATLTVVFNIVKVLLETGMFVSAAVGGFLDNTIPGTDKEKGTATWRKIINPEAEDDHKSSTSAKYKCYDWPFGMSVVKRSTWMQYVPFSPTFTGKFPSISKNKINPAGV